MNSTPMNGTLCFSHTRRRGLTLIELVASLVILTLLAAAGFSLLAATGQTQRYVLQNTGAVSQVELSFRRMLENVRSASQASIPIPTELDLVSQPDTSKAGNPVYNIKYCLIGTQLAEIDDRYGTNILADNVTAFVPSLVQSSKPSLFQITLTLTTPGGDTITRQCYVTARNF
jgi:prepilin-type N-terminal cleavage/methylation domain-containing protein